MASMIHLDHPAAPIGTAALDAPGGFVWWYVDLVGDDGSGLVIIGSFGLPFLPGYTDAARRAEAQPARQRPSLNVVVYEDGREAFYLLQELDPDRCGYDADRRRLTLAGTTFDWDASGQLTIDLDAPLPRSDGRLVGRVQVTGTPCRSTIAPAPEHAHRWTPLLAGATGTADLVIDGAPVALRGTAYHDRNVSPTHLDGLGIDVWFWGRARHGDETRVWYVVRPAEGADPVAWAITIHADGAVVRHDDAAVNIDSIRRDRWGVPWPGRVTITRGDTVWLDAEHGACVDRGPFYLRGPVHAVADDAPGPLEGWAEVVLPRRIDLARHRPLVRMRVHRPDGPNSMWLPLFAGPREGRVRRLFARSTGARP